MSKGKTCGECKSFPGMGYYCPIIGRFCDPNNEKPCEFFEKPMGRVATNGDRIRQGGDDALIDFADGIRRRMCHYCVYSKDKACVNKAGDCWEGVRAWLNAPADACVKQNGNHDTQPDLRKADDTESEGEDE